MDTCFLYLFIYFISCLFYFIILKMLLAFYLTIIQSPQFIFLSDPGIHFLFFLVSFRYFITDDRYL